MICHCIATEFHGVPTKGSRDIVYDRNGIFNMLMTLSKVTENDHVIKYCHTNLYISGTNGRMKFIQVAIDDPLIRHHTDQVWTHSAMSSARTVRNTVDTWSLVTAERLPIRDLKQLDSLLLVKSFPSSYRTSSYDIWILRSRCSLFSKRTWDFTSWQMTKMELRVRHLPMLGIHPFKWWRVDHVKDMRIQHWDRSYRTIEKRSTRSENRHDQRIDAFIDVEEREMKKSQDLRTSTCSMTTCLGSAKEVASWLLQGLYNGTSIGSIGPVVVDIYPPNVVEANCMKIARTS